MAYSQDLRLRVTAAIAAGVSRRAAARFAVSPSTAIRWAERAAREGTPARRVRQPTGGGRVARHLPFLLAEVAATPDMTMLELAARLLAERSVTAHPADVSIRAQVLNLLLDIQHEFGLTYLLIAHDLALVEHVSSRVAVVYLGGVAETGPTEQVFAAPAHPYTRALLEAVPRPDPDHPLPEAPALGEPASALNLPEGCRFHPRCPLALPVCRTAPRPPALAASDGAGHIAACHLLRAETHA